MVVSAPMPFIHIVIALTIFKGVYGNVQFQYDSEQCLGQSVEYQCIVTGSSILQWSVLDDEGGTVGTVLYGSSGGGSPSTTGEVFMIKQLQGTPSIKSSISFTINSSINGYTIICAKDMNAKNNKSLTINIKGPPPPPMDISIASNLTHLHVTWTPPSFTSQCVTISNYSITSNATNSSIITTTDTSVDIPFAGLSPGVYCVSVATVDTANRTGEYSNQECIALEVPSCASLSCNYSSSLNDSSLTICRLLWEFNSSSIAPPLQRVYVYDNVNNNTTVSGSLEYEQITIVRDTHYMFRVYGENVIGNGTTCEISEFVSVPTCATSSVNRSNCDYSSYSPEKSSAVCQLQWEVTSSSLELQWVYIYNSVTDNTTTVGSNIEHLNVTIMNGTHYMFKIHGENEIGNGTTCNSSEYITFVAPSCVAAASHKDCSTHPMDDSKAIFQLCWEFDPLSLNPPLKWVYIIYNNGGTGERVGGNSDCHDITVTRGEEYTFKVFGENMIGNGTICQLSNMCELTEEDGDNVNDNGGDGFSRGELIGTIIGIVLFILLLLSAILLTSALYIKRKKNRDREVKPEESQEESPAANKVTTTYDDVFPDKKDGKAVSSTQKTTTKNNSPPKPKPYRGSGKGGGPSRQAAVSYSSSRQEVQYAEMSLHTGRSHGAGGQGGGGAKLRSPPPVQNVTYADIKHQR